MISDDVMMCDECSVKLLPRSAFVGTNHWREIETSST
jgi:hypothetical protein